LPSPQVDKTDSWVETKASAFINDRGTVKIAVQTNEDPVARSADVTIGGEKVTVDQAATVCNIAALKPGSAQFSSEGGPKEFAVETQGGCEWNAAVDDKAKDWITVDSGASGKGKGTVAITVGPNTGKARTGKITVAITGEEKTREKAFTVSQKRQAPGLSSLVSLGPLQP